MTEKETSELDVAIRELPTSLRMKSQLLSKLWNTEVSENAIDTCAVDADANLDYYIQQCDLYLIEQKRWAVPDVGQEFFMTTHQDIAEVAKKVVSGHKDKRDIMNEMKMKMIPHPASQLPVDGGSLKGGQCDKILGTAIDWAARLVTMLEIGRLQFACQSQEPLTWEQHSLKDYIASVFVPGRLDVGHVRLEESFNVQSLQKLANLEIEWTNDLMSHLSLRNDDTKVLIFHHVSFLEAMDG